MIIRSCSSRRFCIPQVNEPEKEEEAEGTIERVEFFLIVVRKTV
jgi:hypothetical protein